MLRRLKIRSKLVAVLLPLVAALAVLAVIVIRPLLGDVRDARAVTQFAQLAATVNPLVHDLQLEGGLSAQSLATANPAAAEALTVARTNTDASWRQFGTTATTSGGLPSTLTTKLQAAKAAADGLTAMRTDVDAKAATPARAWERYTAAVEALLELQRSIAAEPALSDPALQRRASALVELSLATDALSQERSLLALAMASGNVDRQTFGLLNRFMGAYEEHVRRFRQDADPSLVAAFERSGEGDDAAYTTKVESSVMRPTAEAAVLQGDPVAYFNAMTTRLDALKKIETDAANQLRTGARDALATARQDLVTYAGGLALTLLVALALAALVSRSLTRPVRRLTEAAEAATDRLPQLVEQIQSSNDAVDASVVPISVRAGGEIGQLAEAFNSVQQVAVATAVEQASLRRGIGAMFVNLGRRSQTLVDRQLELIDQLENNEKDPDSLNDLFALDHLATRMRRNAENLLVLAGQEPPRKWGRSLPLIDVIRAAVSEVEDYTRVDVQADEELHLAGHAATDLAHLVAELVENATAFSPPTSRVRVRVERSNERYVVSVVDQGIGMTDADLAATNERLTGASSEIALTNRIGFYVIGRLARRIGVAVRLGRSGGGGVIAQVALPATLVSTSSEEPVAAHGGDADPLADSPQSARERLLGALRSAPGGPTPHGGPSRTTATAAAAASPTASPASAVPTDQRYSGWGDEPDEPAVAPTSAPPAASPAPALPMRRAAAAPPPPVPLPTRPTAAVPPSPAMASPAMASPAMVSPAITPPAMTPPPPPSFAPQPAGAVPAWQPPAVSGTAAPPSPLAPAVHATLAAAAAAMNLAPSAHDRQMAAEGFAGLAPVAGEPVTTAGLPQRRAGGTRRPGPEVPEPAAAAADAGKGRSADDVRSMLSRFRTGVERGRQLPDPTAASTPEDRS